MTIRMKDLLVMNNFGVHSRLCGWMGGWVEGMRPVVILYVLISPCPHYEPTNHPLTN